MINPVHSKVYLLKSALYFMLYGLVKYIPSPVGDFIRWIVLKCFIKKLQTMWIKDGATFWFPDRISIGKNTSVNEFVFINGYGGVSIGQDVLIGHRTSIVADSHGFENPNIEIYKQPKSAKPINIGDDVFFGCNVTVLPGVNIGSGAVIGAGSVVTSNVPSMAIVAGNPARVIRMRTS